MKSLYCLVFILLFAAISCSPEKKKKTTLSFLRTSGHYMVNEENDTILLRGVGLGNWLLPEGYMWHFGETGDRPRKIEKIVEDLTSPEFNKNFWKKFRQNYITEADIKRMKELGFNSVRPALNARVFLTEGENAQFIEENFALLDSLVNWCGKYGIYVILDMHGAPGGQTGQNIDDSPNNEPELFMNPVFEQRLVSLWVKIANRYKENPVVAGYDLLNEPLPERTGAAGKYKHLLLPMYKKLTAEIRKVDKRHMIILEGVNWSNDWSVFNEYVDDNVVYQFHYYCWNEPDNLNDISDFISQREMLNAPVWVGETGESNPAIYFATTQYFEKNNIGWAFWPWKKIDNQQVIYSIPSPEGYDKIVEYSHTGVKPTKELSEKVFTQLLENMKFANCEFRETVTMSLLRKVPQTIYAVNYGHDGNGKSFFAKNDLNAKYYRKNEPVKTVLLEDNNGKRRSSEQAIVLGKGEWTTYKVNADGGFSSNVTIKAKANTSGSGLKISMNDASKEFLLSDTVWTSLTFEKPYFVMGENSFKTECTEGEIILLEFDIQKQP